MILSTVCYANSPKSIIVLFVWSEMTYRGKVGDGFVGRGVRVGLPLVLLHLLLHHGPDSVLVLQREVGCWHLFAFGAIVVLLKDCGLVISA